jgi:hypothetical protein
MSQLSDELKNVVQSIRLTMQIELNKLASVISQELIQNQTNSTNTSCLGIGPLLEKDEIQTEPVRPCLHCVLRVPSSNQGAFGVAIHASSHRTQVVEEPTVRPEEPDFTAYLHAGKRLREYKGRPIVVVLGVGGHNDPMFSGILHQVTAFLSSSLISF